MTRMPKTGAPRRPGYIVAGIVAACGSACLVIGSGCASRGASAPRVIDGTAYGVTEQPFRNRWWQFYERGLSWSRGGLLAEAEADFRACLELRQSDARRARTYGMHFVQCFAHRELGAVLLAQGRTDEAERELRISFDQEPSAKAESLLRRIEQLRGQAARPPAAVDVLGAAPIAPPPAAPATPARIELTSVAAADAAAPAAGDLEVRGRLRDAIDVPLWSVARDGAAVRVATDADGAFTLHAATSSVLKAGAEPASAPVVVALAPPAPAAVLTVDGPDGGQVVPGGHAWYRYDASAHDGLVALEISVAPDAPPKTVPLAGVRSVGTVAVEVGAGRQQVRFVLRHRDGSGASVERTLIGQPPADQDRELRATAVALPLQHPWAADGLAHDDPLLVGALATDGRFRLLDRRDDQALATELGLVEAGYVDRATAAEAGRRLDSRYVIAGTLSRGHNDVECFLRLIQAESGRLVCTADAYADGISGEQVEREFFAAVAGRLRQLFPVVEGRTLVERGDLVLDVGARHGVAVAMRFHVLAPRAGADRDAEHGAEATIEAIDCRPESTRARLISGASCPPGQRAISE